MRPRFKPQVRHLQQNEKYFFGDFLVADYMYTYIHNWPLQPFSHDYDLDSDYWQ